MARFIFTARNRRHLAEQVDRANEQTGLDVTINFGSDRQGRNFFHREYGTGLKTGLTFDELVSATQEAFDLAAEFAARRD